MTENAELLVVVKTTRLTGLINDPSPPGELSQLPNFPLPCLMDLNPK